MRFKKTTGLAAAVFGIVAFFSVEASAQGPTVTATAIGNTITIDVALPPGTRTYTLGAGTAPGQYNIRILREIPATSTHAVLPNVPNGTYYLRAAVGTAISNEAQVTVGGSAQAPTVTATASGNTITIDVALPPGTRTYTLGAGTAPGQYNIRILREIPATSTHAVLPNVPNGTYYLRAAVGSAISNEVQVTAGAPACTSAPAPPVLSVNVANAAVTLNWNGEPGATRYEIGWSRRSGAIEFSEVTSGNSFTRYAPYVGTFYARVRVATACGTSAFSNEVTIPVTSLAPGSGLRTPDPPPGQLLSIPSYGPVVIQQMAAQYAGDLRVACKNNNTWLFKVLRELRKYDSRWGLNWKRGVVHNGVGEMSSDIITYNGTNGPDATAQRVYLVDVISGECESNLPVFNWQNPTYVTWAAGQSSDPACGNRWCAAWTLLPYMNAGFLADEGQQPQQ